MLPGSDWAYLPCSVEAIVHCIVSAGRELFLANAEVAGLAAFEIAGQRRGVRLAD